jgi:hypothetical protein
MCHFIVRSSPACVKHPPRPAKETGLLTIPSEPPCRNFVPKSCKSKKALLDLMFKHSDETKASLPGPACRPEWCVPPSKRLVIIGLAGMALIVSLSTNSSAEMHSASPPKILTGQVRMETQPDFTIQETRRHYAPSPSSAELDATRPKSGGHGIVGIDILIHPDRYPVIQAVFPGTPAQKAGLLPGDTIVAVNGIQTVDKSRSAVDRMISDRPGARVDFTIARHGEIRHISLAVMALEDLAAGLRTGFEAIP